MYVQEISEESIYEESKIYLILYVDDVLIARCNRTEIGKLKHQLHEEFLMKELGEPWYILGMRIEQDGSKKTLRIFQSEYIQKVLKRFNMEKSKLAPTLLPTLIRLSNGVSLRRGWDWVDEKDPLCIGCKKAHVRDGSHSTRPCICHRSYQPL